MQRFAFLAGAAILLATTGLATAQTSSVTVGPNGALSGSTVMPDRPGDQPCRSIGSDDRRRSNSSSMSSTATAGPNGAHSWTSGNGPSVTVRSRDGSSSSSSSASSSGSGTSVVTGSGSGGDCTVYYNRGRDDRRENDD
jgi:hypothetical protein